MYQTLLRLYNNDTVIWYLYWGKYQGVDNHHHMGIARINIEDGQYIVGWLRGIEQKPYKTQKFASDADLFIALDEVIAKR